MGEVLNTKPKCRLASVLLVVIAVLIGVIMFSGCRAPQPVVITQRDSTHVEHYTTYRDTTVIVPGDEAVLKVGSDVTTLTRLMNELRGEVRTIRGANQAALVISATSDTLTVMALCDELQLKLDSVLVENATLTSIVKSTTRFIATQPEQQKPMPSWAKGAALVIGSICLLLLLIILLPALKQLFHGKA